MSTMSFGKKKMAKKMKPKMSANQAKLASTLFKHSAPVKKKKVVAKVAPTKFSPPGMASMDDEGEEY